MHQRKPMREIMIRYGIVTSTNPIHKLGDLLCVTDIVKSITSYYLYS